MLSFIYYLISALCIVYGITIMAARTGSSFFLVWFGLGVLAFLSGLATRLNLWQLLPLIMRRMLLFGFACLFVLFVIVESLILHEFNRTAEKELDYIIVLGAHVTRTGPKPVLRYRLDAALQYMDENPGTLCILSGGQGHNEPISEAEGMKDYLMKKGVDSSRLILEDQSLNTHQNIVNSGKLFDPIHDRVGIVTNDFHLFRSIHLAKGLGIRRVSGIAAGSNPVFLANNLLREFLAVCKDAAAGNLR